MSVVISSVFDDVDTADFALADLKRTGTHVEAYRIRPVQWDGSKEETDTVIGFMNQTNSTPVAPAAIFVDDFRPSSGSSRHQDVHSREVVMLVTVADNDAQNAQCSLVSAGGRQVHSAG